LLIRVHCKSILKFDKISVQIILRCSPSAHLTMVICYNFYFVCFEDHCKLLSKSYQIYVIDFVCTSYKIMKMFSRTSRTLPSIKKV